MPIRVRNTTENEIILNDLGGITIPVGEAYTDLSESFTFIDLALSDDLLKYIANGALIVNTGEVDLSAVDGVRYVSLFKHLNPVYPDGKEVVRSESKPFKWLTVFTMRGDDQAIGDGEIAVWDFSNEHNEIAAPEGYRRKRIKLRFNDPIYVKDYCLYFFDVPFGSYLDLYVVCPAGQYYEDRQGNSIQASEDVFIGHYIVHHMFSGTCSIGDELNSEGCQPDPLLPGHEFWIEVTVPASDSLSRGYFEFELHRERDVLLPGETIT